MASVGALIVAVVAVVAVVVVAELLQPHKKCIYIDVIHNGVGQTNACMLEYRMHESKSGVPLIGELVRHPFETTTNLN